VDAKINHLSIPKDDAARVTSGKVVNLMDALRKSLGSSESASKTPKKPIVREKSSQRKGISLVKQAKAGKKRKSA